MKLRSQAWMEFCDLLPERLSREANEKGEDILQDPRLVTAIKSNPKLHTALREWALVRDNPILALRRERL